MGWFSGMEISSFPGLKNPQKLAQGQKILFKNDFYMGHVEIRFLHG
jgi:hypothetical protein